MSQEAVRRYEFTDGKSSKFWEIEIAGSQFTVRYGKIGTAGQSQVKEFADADAAAATKAADKLIAEKTGKGYQEVGGSAPTITSVPEPVAATTVKKAKPTKAAMPLTELAKDSETLAPLTSAAITGTRYFEYSDSKFWEIKSDLLRSMYTVRHGTIGSIGRETTKEFDDAQTMVKEAQRLIKENVGKGFVEKTMIDRAHASLPIAYESIALYEEAKRLIRTLQREIEQESDWGEVDENDPTQLPEYLADALRGSLAWKFLIDEVSYVQVDRCKSMLKGPFFITDEYPVPKAKTGEYMVPIIQADLRELTKLRGIPFGDGLLQAWFAWDEWECRVIPRQVVAQQTPLPFPMDIEAFNETCRVFIEDWMSPETLFGSSAEDSERVVPVISGYCNPQVHIDVRIEEDIEGSSNQNLARVLEILRTLEDASQFRDHAFGSFHGIHNRPHEVDADCLFAFEDEYFSFGGAGNAHVMYEFNDGKPNFYFTWAHCR